MKRFGISAGFGLCLAILALAGCSTTMPRITAPLEVIATVSKPRYTGWQMDYCSHEEAINPSTACLASDGDLYRVELKNVRTAAGLPVARVLTAGFTGRAMPRDFQARIPLHLVKAGAGFQRDTGIEFIAARE